MSIRTMLINFFFLPEPFYSNWHHHLETGDFLCPQAFGRNTYEDEEIGVIIRKIYDHFEGNPIAIFEELRTRGFDPGQPNRILARRCIELASISVPVRTAFDQDVEIQSSPRVFLPVIGQWEVLYAMWHEKPAWYARNQGLLTPIWPPLKDYLGTRGMLLIVKDLAAEHLLRMPILIAHPEHIQRCFFIARKIFGYSVAIDRDMIRYDIRSFDQGSVQKWTRSSWSWLRYEMMARLHHRLKGWI